MSARDLIKKSILEGFSDNTVTTSTIIVTLSIACLIAAYIFVVYYMAAKKTFYNKSFNISIAAISIITASIILAMQSNLVISLGMVGALSIVRFRTAVKDPMDLIFLFWSISVGIICGAGKYEIAVMTSLIITVVIFALELTPVGQASMLLIVNASEAAAEDAVMKLAGQYCKFVKVKSRNISERGMDLVIACKVKEEAALIQEVSRIEQVHHVSLIAHDGDVTF